MSWPPLRQARGHCGYGVVVAPGADRSAAGEPGGVTTNRGLPGWGSVFGDDVVASAVLDRLLHRAVVFNIRGPSWRIREHPTLSDGPDDNGHHGKRQER